MNIPETKRILFTLLIILLYRLGANIPVPYISQDVLSSFNKVAAGSIFQFINIISGNAFGKATLFALSVQPYITASIVIQLLTVAIPALEKMSKDENGKKKLTAATRWVTVGIGIVMAYGYAMLMSSYNMLTFTSTDEHRFSSTRLSSPATVPAPRLSCGWARRLTNSESVTAFR